MKAITTKYLGATNFKGSRIIATDGDNRVIVHYNDNLSSFENHVVAVKALCEKLRWKGKLQAGDTKHGIVFVWITKYDNVTV